MYDEINFGHCSHLCRESDMTKLNLRRKLKNIPSNSHRLIFEKQFSFLLYGLFFSRFEHADEFFSIHNYPMPELFKHHMQFSSTLCNKVTRNFILFCVTLLHHECLTGGT